MKELFTKERVLDAACVGVLAALSAYAALVWITAHPGWTVWK